MNMEVPSDDPRFGMGYMVVAYSVLIAAFFGYVAFNHIRAARLRRRLEEVERKLGLGDATTGP